MSFARLTHRARRSRLGSPSCIWGSGNLHCNQNLMGARIAAATPSSNTGASSAGSSSACCAVGACPIRLLRYARRYYAHDATLRYATLSPPAALLLGSSSAHSATASPARGRPAPSSSAPAARSRAPTSPRAPRRGRASSAAPRAAAWQRLAAQGRAVAGGQTRRAPFQWGEAHPHCRVNWVSIWAFQNA